MDLFIDVSSLERFYLDVVSNPPATSMLSKYASSGQASREFGSVSARNSPNRLEYAHPAKSFFTGIHHNDSASSQRHQQAQSAADSPGRLPLLKTPTCCPRSQQYPLYSAYPRSEVEAWTGSAVLCAFSKEPFIERLLGIKPLSFAVKIHALDTHQISDRQILRLERFPYAARLGGNLKFAVVDAIPCPRGILNRVVWNHIDDEAVDDAALVLSGHDESMKAGGILLLKELGLGVDRLPRYLHSRSAAKINVFKDRRH